MEISEAATPTSLRFRFNQPRRDGTLITPLKHPSPARPSCLCLKAKYWSLSEQSWGYVIREVFNDDFEAKMTEKFSCIGDIDSHVDLGPGAVTALFGFTLRIVAPDSQIEVACADSIVTQQLLESKCNLALSMQQANFAKLCPQSFVVPADFDVDLLLRPENPGGTRSEVAEKLSRISRENPWVLKLDGSSCGLAVHFVVDPKEAARLIKMEQLSRDLENRSTGNEQNVSTRSMARTNWVCQRHIEKPLLVRGGRKFHLRAFTLSFSGKTFLFEGALFARLCAKPWSKNDLQDPKKNLSNHTQAQKNLPGGAAKKVDVGLLATSEELPLLQAACPNLIPRIRRLVRRAIRIGQVNDATICGFKNKHKVEHQWTEFCLLAFDIMVNEDGRLFILEVNRGPGGIERETSGMSKKFRSGMRQMIRETAALTVAEGLSRRNRHDLSEVFLSDKNLCGFKPLLVPSQGNVLEGDITDSTILAIRRSSIRNGTALKAERLVWEFSGGLSGVVQQSFGEELGKPEQKTMPAKKYSSAQDFFASMGENDDESSKAEEFECQQELAERRVARGWRDHLVGFEDKQGRSALQLAVITKAGPDVCRLLISLGADATKTIGKYGAPILHYAVTALSDIDTIQALLSAGASTLDSFQGICALELAAAAVADASAELQNFKELKCIADALLADARRKNFDNLHDPNETRNPLIVRLLKSAPSLEGDRNALLKIGKALNDRLKSQEFSFDSKNSPLKEEKIPATFLFDDSKSCEMWLSEGAVAMSTGNYEEAASCFYQAMVGADVSGIAEAQRMLKTAVQAARSAGGLEMLILSSSDEDY